MLIVCPSCASEYTIDPAKLGADGRTLRCAICRDTWFVKPDGALPGAAARDEGATEIPQSGQGSAPERPKPAATRGLALGGLAGLAVAGWLAFPGVFPSVEQWAATGGRALMERVRHADAQLTFRNVTSELDPRAGDAVLIVRGEISNGSAREATLPPLEILVRNEDEQVLATWTSAPPRPNLGPGEAVRFETRLASPPPEGRQVRVHFTAAGGIAMAARSPD
jgi:predicted Zn finger-like uncharacterized protein